MAEESVMDAVNAALGVTSDDSSGSADDAELLESGAGEGGDESAAGDEGGEGEGAGDEGGEGEEAPHGFARDPETGKFVKIGSKPEGEKPEGEKPAGEKPAAAKPGEKPGEKPAAKAPDAINDPIPKDLKPATQERIRTLVSTARELTQERDQVRNDFNYMIEGIKATGTTPEQYGEVLSFMALFNSNDPTQQEKALELIEGVAERLATLLGKERAPSDVLANHPDLREAVAKGQITPAYARQVATLKNKESFRTEITTAHSAQEQQQREAAQELATARSDLNALEETLQRNDPQYNAKKAQIVPILKPIFATIRPSQWKAAFENAYKNAKISGVAPARRAATPANQPMRAGRASGAGGTGGEMAKQPESGLDAINQALASMGK